MAKKPASQIVQENYDRLMYGRARGHRKYCHRARLLERNYLGGGEQWDDADRYEVESEGRPAEEINQILPSVNAALGYQIQNRMQAAFLPVGQGADQHSATILSKVIKSILINTQYHWRETEVFGDGLIQQRGYFDIRVEFDESMLGDCVITVPDPMDVIPDPDANQYDPDDWSDVIVTRWMSQDEIAAIYGDAKAREVKESDTFTDTREDEEDRNAFGDDEGRGASSETWDNSGTALYRVIDRQRWVRHRSDVLVSPEGDVELMDGLPPEKVQAMLGAGWIKTKRMQRRIWWTVTTDSTLLHDDYSPYRHFTIVPFFPIFRRGKTRGMVDNALSPQRVLNKSVSQFLAVVNTAANSGWQMEEDQLVNMTEEELEENGAKTGLVLVRKRNTQPLAKIQPNQVPSGIDRILGIADASIRDTTGINDSMRADASRGESGIAIQSKQFAAQQQLAPYLDNLARTRRMVAMRILDIVQKFYTEERVIRITETDALGQDISESVPVNQRLEDGSILNNLTIGQYDVVITEQPMQVTFENGQFNQALELRTAGVAIPDPFLVRYSNLVDKQEIVEAMQGSNAPPPDPVAEAEAELKRAQARKADAEAINKSVEAQYSATTAAQLVASMPSIATLGDQMLRSAGFVDRDAGPIIPTPAGSAADIGAIDIPENTNPLTPPNPAVGATDGIETGITPETV